VTLSVRCSALPRILRCSASADAPDLPIASTSDAAETGTEVHRHAARLVQTGAVDWDAVPRSPEVRMLVAAAVRAWSDLGLGHLPAIEELSLSATVGTVTVTGHADSVILGEDGTATILDWKTGRLDTDYREQMRGYACLLLIDSARTERVDTVTVWLRDGEIERHTFDRDDLAAWCDQIAALGAAGSYTSGPHCTYCPRSHECPAWNALARRDAAALLDVDPATLADTLATMPAEKILDLYRQAKRVDAIAYRVKEALRLHVTKSGDVVADGARLTMTTEHRREIDTAAAWPILESELTDAELAACVSVSVSKVEDAVAKKAGRGKGAAAKRALAERLEAAGAVTLTQISKLTERRNPT